MLVLRSVDILDTCQASLPPYQCWEKAALLLKNIPVREHHLHDTGLLSDCSANAAAGQNIMDIDRIEWLSIEQNCYRLKRLAFDRTEWLQKEQNSYRQKRMVIN